MPENLSKTDLINRLVGARERGERPVAPDANLRGANLRGANLRGADLRGARIIHLAGLPSGETIFMPTPGGWYLTVGC